MKKELSSKASDFIDDVYLHSLINEISEDKEKVRDIFRKSKSKQALTVEETAQLIAIKSDDLLEELFQTARELKKSVYGNRIVLFAPLYIGNQCTNNCLYCGFRSSLKDAIRKTLNQSELIAEVESLENEGHKRLILVFGEHPIYSPEFIANSVKTCYSIKRGKGEIRRVNINAAPLDVEGFKIVKSSGIGTYQVFQETYHKETYAKFHPGPGTKSDFMWRLNSMERAFEGGIDDMGIGALFGLYDWRFEVLGLVSHAHRLQEICGVGPHTISFPRVKPALGMNIELPYEVSDNDFKKLVAILRLSVPYTGLIMTARESAELRDAVIEFGVSQIDAGTRLEIGGYQGKDVEQHLEKEQFVIADSRELDSVIQWLLSKDFIPSFCTSCYRVGRTGEHFMEYAIPGFIGNFCTPNAMLTLAEYLEDYSSDETKKEGYLLIERELDKINNEKRRDELKEKILLIKNGKRDLLY